MKTLALLPTQSKNPKAKVIWNQWNLLKIWRRTGHSGIRSKESYQLAKISWSISPWYVNYKWTAERYNRWNKSSFSKSLMIFCTAELHWIETIGKSWTRSIPTGTGQSETFCFIAFKLQNMLCGIKGYIIISSIAQSY